MDPVEVVEGILMADWQSGGYLPRNDLIGPMIAELDADEVSVRFFFNFSEICSDWFPSLGRVPVP